MLRKELQPPKINEGLVEELMQLIEEISGLVEEAYEEDYLNDENSLLKKKIRELNLKTKKEYEPTDFAEYWGYTSLEDLAKEVALPNPPIMKDITIEEVSSIIDMIMNLKSPEGIEEVEEVEPYITYYLELMEKSIPNSDISDLIYWYDVEDYGHEPTPREIAEKAFENRDEEV